MTRHRKKVRRNFFRLLARDKLDQNSLLIRQLLETELSSIAGHFGGASSPGALATAWLLAIFLPLLDGGVQQVSDTRVPFVIP